MYKIYQSLLDKKGLKNADIARATGISNMTFSDWKNGRSNPKTDKLQKIADYFGVSLEYLTTGKEVEKENYYLDDETAKTAQEIFENDKVLFDVYNSTDKEKLMDYVKMLRHMQLLEKGDE